MLKKISLLALMGIALVQVQAQTDTTKAPETAADTMQIGNIIILKNGSSTGSGRDELTINIHRRHWDYPSNVTTNWLSLDLGFNGFSDQTNYSGLTSGYGAGTNKELFDLRNGKSVNVNIWFVMQRLNLIKHVVNLKYGLGLELNNYRYDSDVKFDHKPATVYDDLTHDYTKNKLAADYLTIPVMINFNFTPRRNPLRSIGFSAGIAGSYLYSSRHKFITREDGKEKTKGNLGLNALKYAWVGEVKLGPISVYGNYSPESMFKNGLDHRPWAVGLRLPLDMDGVSY
ncbi:MAG TPA: outer membrane beta-barrel protein [Flavihumibacter sp.]|nr:outer membrane beta-barrel protein [Bacteroidota bacterium]HOA37613.1 outer membrane beta-barrel protein [Flavihumibacter sp.]HPZ87881.1 outer membrane beta-barrel protein [Flavihumibacter sp.]